MSKIVTLGSIEGQIRATVILEFVPMQEPMADEHRTAASKFIQIQDTNARLDAVARSIAQALEQETIEQLENRMPRHDQSI